MIIYGFLRSGHCLSSIDVYVSIPTDTSCHYRSTASCVPDTAWLLMTWNVLARLSRHGPSVIKCSL